MPKRVRSSKEPASSREWKVGEFLPPVASRLRSSARLPTFVTHFIYGVKPSGLARVAKCRDIPEGVGPYRNACRKVCEKREQGSHPACMKSLAEMNCKKPPVKFGDFLKSRVKARNRSQRWSKREETFADPSRQGTNLISCHKFAVRMSTPPSDQKDIAVLLENVSRALFQVRHTEW